MAFTLNGVAARIQEMDFEASAWKRYVALCALAHIRGTEKKVLETKIFGKDKPSSNFKGAWTISGKFFANLSRSQVEAIGDMNLDEAATGAMSALQAHMTALGVAGKNAYAEVAHYADTEALEAARKKAAEDAAAEAAAKAEAENKEVEDELYGETEGETPAPAPAPAPEIDVVAMAKALIDGMTMGEMNEIAVYLTERLTNAQMTAVAA